MMSELEFQHGSGSSSQGLTFVRPLPQARVAPGPEAGDRSSVKAAQLGLIDRLFPPRSDDDSESLPPVTGVEIGHFIVEERIGRGGMGAVFRAIDQRLDRVVALKVLSPEHSQDPDAVQRFQNEAKAAARLDHDNIARVHYIGEESGIRFIAFEFVTGTNIRTLIAQKGRLSPAEAVNYTLQIAEALRHTEASHVVHRDIKPSNLIVSPTGRAKLVDLGLARHNDSPISKDLTTAGTALGTFDYIAPEQALDARKVDVRSDIYSLGCTLYHMLTGSPPYPTGTMFEKVMNHHRAAPPNPRDLCAAVSAPLAHIVQKMMASNPDDRYASPVDLIHDLSEVAHSLGLQPSIPETMVWTPALPPVRRSIWEGASTWMAVALLLVVLVIADRLRRPQRQLPSDVATPSLGDASSSLPDVAPATQLPQPLTESSPEQGITLVPTLGESRKMAPAFPEFSGTVPPPVPAPAGSETTLPSRVHTPEEWWNEQLLSPIATLAEQLASSSGFMGQDSVPAPATPDRPPEAAGLPREAPLISANPNSRTAPDLTPVPVTGDPFIVVNPANDERIGCSTLAVACATAKDLWAIEVQPAAAEMVQQEPLTITDKRIRIRPGRDYQPTRDRRPLLRFDLAKQQMMGSLTSGAEVIRLNRGAVEIYDLDLELQIDPASILDWSLVSLQKGSRLTAQGAALTIVNPYRVPTTLASVPPEESEELRDLMPDRMMSRQNSIELKDCVVRGQFDLVSQRATDALSVNLQNTAVAISGWLMKVDGSGTYAASGFGDDATRQVSLQLDHVTAVTGLGLLQATSGEHGVIPPLRLAIANSVIRVEQAGQPVLEITGHEDADLLREALQVDSNRDPSFLQVQGPVCVIDSTTSILGDTSRELTAEQIGIGTAERVTDNLIMLRPLPESGAWHRIQPSDLELRPSDDNPAIGASGDLQNAGVNWQSLRLPFFLGSLRTPGSVR